jgi:hypothetical protein
MMFGEVIEKFFQLVPAQLLVLIRIELHGMVQHSFEIDRWSLITLRPIRSVSRIFWSAVSAAGPSATGSTLSISVMIRPASVDVPIPPDSFTIAAAFCWAAPVRPNFVVRQLPILVLIQC